MCKPIFDDNWRIPFFGTNSKNKKTCRGKKKYLFACINIWWRLYFSFSNKQLITFVLSDCILLSVSNVNMFTYVCVYTLYHTVIFASIESLDSVYLLCVVQSYSQIIRHNSIYAVQTIWRLYSYCYVINVANVPIGPMFWTHFKLKYDWMSLYTMLSLSFSDNWTPAQQKWLKLVFFLFFCFST